MNEDTTLPSAAARPSEPPPGSPSFHPSMRQAPAKSSPGGRAARASQVGGDVPVRRSARIAERSGGHKVEKQETRNDNAAASMAAGRMMTRARQQKELAAGMMMVEDLMAKVEDLMVKTEEEMEEDEEAKVEAQVVLAMEIGNEVKKVKAAARRNAQKMKSTYTMGKQTGSKARPSKAKGRVFSIKARFDTFVELKEAIGGESSESTDGNMEWIKNTYKPIAMAIQRATVVAVRALDILVRAVLLGRTEIEIDGKTVTSVEIGTGVTKSVIGEIMARKNIYRAVIAWRTGNARPTKDVYKDVHKIFAKICSSESGSSPKLISQSTAAVGDAVYISVLQNLVSQEAVLAIPRVIFCQPKEAVFDRA